MLTRQRRSHVHTHYWGDGMRTPMWNVGSAYNCWKWGFDTIRFFFFFIDTERLPGQQSVAMIVFTDWAKIEIKMFLKDISVMIKIVAHLYMFHAHVAGSLHAQMIRKPKRHHKRVTLSSKMFLSHLIICGWKAWCLGITLKLKNTILSSFDL